jgi:type IV pilus assembly protein PilV
MKMRDVAMNQKGFSLIELVIATSILAVGLLALAEMQITSIKGNALSSTTTDATTVAQDRLEQLIGQTYSSLATDTNTDLAAGDHPAGTQTIGGTQAVQGITYTITWSITDDSPITNTKTIDLDVTWTENNQSRTVSVQGVKPRID